MTKVVYIVADSTEPLENIAKTVADPMDGYSSTFQSLELAQEYLENSLHKDTLVIRKVSVSVE
jgi:hypothetical protein